MQANQSIALVTGASGFIGSEVVRRLAMKKIRVRVLLRKTSSLENLKGLDYEVVTGDLSDHQALEKAADGVDYVFHLAGTIFAKDRETYFEHNAVGTRNLVEACVNRAAQLKRFVYVSSIAAAGPSRSKKPKVESDACDPVSDYGASKLGGEFELKNKGYRLSYTIIRPPAVYGPRDRAILELAKIVNLGVTPIFPSVGGESQKLLNVIFVDDLVEGIVSAAFSERQKQHEEFFLVGDGVFTWDELMRSMAQELGKKTIPLKLPRLVWMAIAGGMTAYSRISGKPQSITLDKLREVKQDFWVFSSDRAKERIGFAPKWTLQDGMRKTLRAYRDAGWLK